MKPTIRRPEKPAEPKTSQDHRPPPPPASVVLRNGAASTDQAYPFWFPASSGPESGGAA